MLWERSLLCIEIEKSTLFNVSTFQHSLLGLAHKACKSEQARRLPAARQKCSKERVKKFRPLKCCSDGYVSCACIKYCVQPRVK